MWHKIVEAIIENGQIKYVNDKLPGKKIKVHLIYDYDNEEEYYPKAEVAKMVKETSGIYKDIDVKAESKILRESWERNAWNWVSDRYEYFNIPYQRIREEYRISWPALSLKKPLIFL